MRQSGSFSAAACWRASRRKRLVVGVEGRQVGPERDARSARQRAHVDKQIGRLLVGERERIGKHQPAFRIGIADLDGQALARAIDVERPERRARDGILDRRDQNAQPHRQLAVHDHVRERERRRGAAHVLLHDQHRGRRLEVEAAGVEADALADQRDLRRRRIAPVQIDQARRAVGGAADRVDEREILLQQIVADRWTRTLAPWRSASARAAASSSAGPISFAGVLMRSRASVTPSTMRARSAASTPSGSASRTSLSSRLR